MSARLNLPDGIKATHGHNPSYFDLVSDESGNAVYIVTCECEFRTVPHQTTAVAVAAFNLHALNSDARWHARIRARDERIRNYRRG